MTHSTPDSPECRSCAMLGSAVLTTAMSSISIAVATQTSASVPVLLNILGLLELVERRRRADNVAAVACEQAGHLVHGRHHRVGRRRVVAGGDSELDEELLDSRGADRRQHAPALGADDVGVGDSPWGEAVVPRL